MCASWCGAGECKTGTEVLSHAVAASIACVLVPSSTGLAHTTPNLTSCSPWHACASLVPNFQLLPSWPISCHAPAAKPAHTCLSLLSTHTHTHTHLLLRLFLPAAPLCHAPCFRSHHVPLADSGHPGPRRVRSHAQRLQQRHTGPGRQQAQHGGAHAPRCERIPGPWRERAVGLVAWAGGRGQHAPASGGALPATFAAATTARASTAGAHRSCTAPAPAVAPVHHGAHAAAGAAAAAAAANGAGHADCPPQQGGAEHGGHANGWLTARLARVCA
eukprot:scaffold29462_cov20-Tisochrysis_lutea.AAC.1